jgi:lipopolysaccharide/colanic/teichoic acid biosynthesis glycosyltransferase
VPVPASRGFFKVHFAVFDTFWALAAPLIALYVRDAPILSVNGLADVSLYCSVSVICSLISFAAFRLHEGMTRYFSVHDALDIAKSVTAAIFLTAIALFTITRLDGVPRVTLLVQALVLGAGLITARTFARLSETHRSSRDAEKYAQENIIVIGANRLSSLYLRLLEAHSPNLHRLMAVFDNRPRMVGRALERVRIVGTVDHLASVINEFAWHGISIDRVLIGAEKEELAEDEVTQVRSICATRDIRLHFIPELIGVHQLRRSSVADPIEPVQGALEAAAYFRLKRLLDFAAAITIIIGSAPLWLFVALLVLLDVGSPVLFWQQRLGVGGRTFLVYKFRTLKAPFDRDGNALSESDRLSATGRLLRKFRLDEIPQLLNVLVGDMSLIGPRPLLPQDQPANPSLRLSIRPGITGWAQVRGGTAVTAQEKDALDEWYIRNASAWLDAKIAVLTGLFLFVGEKRSEQAIHAARAIRKELQSEQPAAKPNAASLQRGDSKARQEIESNLARVA